MTAAGQRNIGSSALHIEADRRQSGVAVQIIFVRSGVWGQRRQQQIAGVLTSALLASFAPAHLGAQNREFSVPGSSSISWASNVSEYPFSHSETLVEDTPIPGLSASRPIEHA